MTSTLADHNLSPLSDNEKETFLLMMHNSIKTGSSAKLLGIPLISEFPSEGSEESAKKFFDPENDTIDSHKEDKKQFHTMVFQMVDVIGGSLDLPVSAPALSPIVDPTTPLLKIIASIEIPGVSEQILLENLPYMMENAKNFSDAFTKFSNGDVEDLTNLVTGIDNSLLEKKPDIQKSLEEASESVALDISESVEVDISVSVPEPPFIDVGDAIEGLPHMSIPGVGIIPIYAKLLQSIVTAPLSIVNTVIQSLSDFLIAMKNGAIGIVEYLVDLVKDLVLNPIKAYFSNFFETPGFVALISTFIIFVISMIIITVVGLLLGVGMIQSGVKQILFTST